MNLELYSGVVAFVERDINIITSFHLVMNM